VAVTYHQNVLVFDLGGTKLASAVINPASGKLLSFCQSPTPADGGSAACMRTMFDLGRRAMQEAGVETAARVGISFGGPVSSDRQYILRSYHISGWEGMALPRIASEEFNCPASMDNDANAAALGAWTFDAQQKVDNLIYIQISTGVGSGFILDRKLYRGSALAGEFGHMNIQPGGPRCTCGKDGCVESVCSGWALAREGRAALQKVDVHSPLYRIASEQTGPLDARLVFQAAREDDASAKLILENAFTLLGMAVANLIYLFDPGMIILGGGVMRSEDMIQPILQTTLDREVLPLFKNRYQLRFSRLDGRETLLGAALLCVG
jgi:glucokinase